MFDIVRNNRRIVQGFLALITLPFAFWGVESYVRNADTGTAVATVGGGKIGQAELQNALREQQDRMRAQLGPRFDPATFDTPEVRRAVLDSLVTQRLLAEQTQKARLTIGNDQLVGYIASAPNLQEGGKFSNRRYEALVAAQGMSKEMFEAKVRQDLAMQQLLVPVADAGINSNVAGRRWLAGQLEQREIGQATLLADAYLGQVKLAPEAAQAFYEANRKRFELPEQIRAEFVVLSRDLLMAQAVVSDEEVGKYYESHADRYKTAETRRASHILIKAAKDAPAAEVNAAKAKAEELLAQLRKAPGEFARLAKQNSSDTLSAERGGDLDWFGRGAMVKPFEEAVFALKEGQISDVVRSDFGFHVIQLTGLRKEQVKPLAEAKAEIVAELKRESATKRYSEAAEAFGNMVYEQSDSLKPAADKWNLKVAQTPWLARGATLQPPFDNRKLLGALFSDDAIKNKRNTEAVEVAPGTLVSARVVEHKPAELRAFEAVRADIEKHLAREEAVKLAAKDGEEKLARLAKGEQVSLSWMPPRYISRVDPQGQSAEALRAIYRVDAAKMPAYVGVALPGAGYTLYRVASVRAVDPAKEDVRGRMLGQQYARAVSEEEFAAWMATLRDAYPVTINKAALEVKER